MPRIALGLEYDGTDFVGWQIQPVGRSVEGALAAAVRFVAGEPIGGARRRSHGCRRPRDAASRAFRYTRARRTPRQWMLGINSNLPPDIAIRWVQEVPVTFDARRSAVSRRYRYTILQQPARPALLRRRVWWLRQSLDCAAMTAAAAAWVGEHDFLVVSRHGLPGEVADAPRSRRSRSRSKRSRTRRVVDARVHRQRVPAAHGAQSRRHAGRRSARGELVPPMPRGHSRERATAAWPVSRRRRQACRSSRCCIRSTTALHARSRTGRVRYRERFRLSFAGFQGGERRL